MVARSLLLTLAAVAALSALATQAEMATPAGTPSPAATVAPIVWRLQSFVDPRGAPTPLDKPDRYTIQIASDGQLQAQVDCNRGRGKATVEGSTIKIEGIATTRMACEKTSRGPDFLAALDAATHWRYDGPDLLLIADDGSALRFAPSLVEVVWQWQGTAMMNDTRIVPSDPTNYTLAFHDGKVAIRADCNRLAGRFTMQQSQIDIAPSGIPTGVCAPGSESDRFLRDLDAVSSFVFQSGRLYLALPADAGIMEFAAVIPSAEATPTAGNAA
jgi:heat shock protein HslJ